MYHFLQNELSQCYDKPSVLIIECISVLDRLCILTPTVHSCPVKCL